MDLHRVNTIKGNFEKERIKLNFSQEIMDAIEKILHQYGENGMLHAPYQGNRDAIIPEELFAILQVSNGISERMCLPDSGEKEEIGWIFYPYEMMLEWTTFYQANYGIEGVIFSEDGADGVYCLKPNGTVTCFYGVDDEEIQVADTLWDFLGGHSHFAGKEGNNIC